MVSVLPSETKFGINALLPHRTITHDSDGSVMVDGQKVARVEGMNLEPLLRILLRLFAQLWRNADLIRESLSANRQIDIQFAA